MNSLYLALAISALIALVVGSAFYAGVWWESQSQIIRDLEDYREGTEDAKDATSDLPADDSGNIEWLKQFVK